MTAPDAAEPARRSIRARGEVPRLLLEAARELFAAKGFDATPTEEIAARAGVSKALLFRHFGSKAGLFEHAVSEPFARFVTDCIDRWEQIGVAGRAPGSLATELVRDLSRLFHDNRELMLAVLAVASFGTAGPDVEHRPRAEMTRLVERMEHLARAEAEGRGAADLDFPVLVRSVVAAAAGMALLQPWLLGPGIAAPDRERLETGMTDLLLRSTSTPPTLKPE